MTRTDPAGRFTPARVGSFTLTFATQRFNWSAEVAAIHGYQPEPMEVTADVALAHQHPEDRPRVDAMLAELVTSREPVSGRHRIIDTAGEVHDIIVVSKSLVDGDGVAIGVQGFYVDISAVFDDRLDEAVDLAVAEFAVNRAVIEQAKGMVMMAYNIPADRAFDVLKWRSQQSNVKIRALCELIVKRAVDELTLLDVNRATFDDILLNVGSIPPAAP